MTVRVIVFVVAIVVVGAVLFISPIHRNSADSKKESQNVSNPANPDSNQNNTHNSNTSGTKTNGNSSNTPVSTTDVKSKLFGRLTNVDQKLLDLEKSRSIERPAIVRSQLVTLNLNELIVGATITLNLFHDLSFNVLLEQKTKATGVSTNDIWKGKLLGNYKGDFTMVVTPEGIASGYISAMGRNRFEINYTPSGVHVIDEVDETKLPPPSKPVIPK